MTKRVSQEYFDESVETIIELLDLNLDEAIKETEESFVAQGINLSNIVLDFIKFKEIGHPIEIAVREITQCLEELNSKQAHLKTALTNLKEQCELDLAHRLLAVKLGALDILRKCIITTCSDPTYIDLSVFVIETTCSLLTNQADIVSGIILHEFCKTLREAKQRLIISDDHTTDNQLLQLAALCKLLRLSCVMHEPNRTLLSGTPVIPGSVQLLSEIEVVLSSLNLSRWTCVIREVCALLRCMTQDDDVRVEFGEGSNCARAISSTTPAIELLLKFTRAAAASTDTDALLLAEFFITLAAILTREEFCQSFQENDGISVVFDALMQFPESIAAVSASLSLIKVLCGADSCKRLIGQWSSLSCPNLTGPQLILQSSERHFGSANVVKNATAAIAAMTLRQPDLATMLVEAGAAELLIKVLEHHSSNTSVVRPTCMAIRNCVSRSPELRPAFLRTQGGSGEASDLEALLNRALLLEGCADEAKAALRDLGCKVDLKELWVAKTPQRIADTFQKITL